jgi:RHS repeat-associated protein
MRGLTPLYYLHTYGYDSLNRLTSLGVKNSLAQTLRSYVYTLTPTGRRQTVTESTGRAVTYGYDTTYRLTSEAITGASAHNGVVGYTLDAVGNRLARSSSVSAIPATSNTYNVRDWLNTDTYDANGNTLLGLLAPGSSLPAPDVYDFEDRLIVRRKADGSTVNLSYDADGIRIGKTVLNLSSQLVSITSYLVCTNNLTGYSQVLEERTTSAVGTTFETYIYGHDLLAQITKDQSQVTIRYYVYDGGGSVRALINESGAITDTWDYDAFGNLVGRTGTSDNAYLYRGEQFDADLRQYYLRARFYNPSSGRFWNQDTYEGSNADPASLHKYLYAHSDPVNGIDPSGHFTLTELQITQSITSTLQRISNLRLVRVVKSMFGSRFADINWVQNGSHSSIFVDFKDNPVGVIYEIVTGYRRAFPKLPVAPPYLDYTKGTFRIRPGVAVGKKTKIASLSRNQFAAWNLFVVPLGYSHEHGSASVLYSVPGLPGSVNCLAWTAEAASAALLIRLIPMGS